MSVFALVALCAGLLAWLSYRHDLRQTPVLSSCALAVGEASSRGLSGNDLLNELLSQERCRGDAVYIDAVVSLLLPFQRFDEARALLEEGQSRRALVSAEAEAIATRITLAESHARWAEGALPEANALFDGAKSVADRLHARWPEWSLPYALQADIAQEDWATNHPSPPTDWYRVQQDRRRDLASGAFLRAFSAPQIGLFVFVVSLMALAALVMATKSLSERQTLARLVPTPIAAATPGPVTLTGTLHLLPNDQPVIGPYSKQPGVWWQTQRESMLQAGQRLGTRSQQAFLLRDASGEVVISPLDIVARTRHEHFTLGGFGFVKRRATFESLLKEGDAVTVSGELRLDESRGRATVVRGSRGERLFVSNISIAELQQSEQRWLLIFAAIGALALALLAWSYQQRYLMRAIPGVLP